MAHSTLPVFSHPDFQQVLEALTGFEIRHVEKTLSLCSHESPESSYGACDGGLRCQSPATVSDRETGCGWCLEHFEEVELG